MGWNSRDYRFDSNGGNGNSSFEQHNKHMREFHKSHANVAMVNGSRLDEAAFLESLLFLRVNYVVETGGSVLLNDQMDWSTFNYLSKVAKYKLSQN